MSRPTMERAIEAIERGDPEQAKALCEAMKHESQFMHDLLVDGVAGLISFVKDKLGDEGVEEAWSDCARAQLAQAGRDDRRVATAARSPRPLAATWRAHSTSGVGPQPGGVRDLRGRREAHLHHEPCGSGQRLWRIGRYGPEGWGVTDEAHDWSYGREGFPLYCTHCAFMNETLPIRWIGYPVYPSDPPEDFDRDPCTWYWYKDPADIPDRHWERYGLERDAAG